MTRARPKRPASRAAAARRIRNSVAIFAIVLAVVALSVVADLELNRGTHSEAAKPVPTPSAARAPAPTPSAARAPAPRSTSGASGFPDAANTGYAQATGYPGSLTDCSGVTIRSNTTYSFCDFTDGLDIGSSDSSPTNVTFVGCRFASHNMLDADVADYGSNITISYSTFEPNTVPASAEPTSPYATAIARSNSYQYGLDQRHPGALTIDHSDFWGFAEAVQLGYSSRSGPVTISNTWIHNPRDPGGSDPSTDDHTDGILENYGGLSYMTFDHNSIIGDGNTQALALQGTRPYNHITVTNNYFSGYGYMVCIGAHTPDTNMVFAGNVWGTEFKPGFGPMYDGVSFTTQGLGGVWRDNTIQVTPGTSWMAAGNNHLYWWPDDTNPSSSHQIVGHTRDFEA